MYKLKLSEPFVEDVNISVNYIKNTLLEPIAAQRLKDDVKKAYKKIRENPLIYPVVPDKYLSELGYRFKMVKNYILFYIVEKKVIKVTRFLHGHRDWMNILGK